MIKCTQEWNGYENLKYSDIFNTLINFFKSNE